MRVGIGDVGPQRERGEIAVAMRVDGARVLQDELVDGRHRDGVNDPLGAS